MSTQSLIDSNRAGAEIYTDPTICKSKSSALLTSFHLPSGLLPLSDLAEVGHNPTTGFVWLRQKTSTVHTFNKIGRQVSYGQEITAFVEDKRMKKLTGVKSKEMLVWVSLSEMFVSEDDVGKISFKTPSGLSRTFPVEAFEEDGK